jgi:hypothetical protein
MSLAVVLPAYQARFLRHALHSLAAQTDRDFTLYVADDASPEEIRTLCDEFRTQLRIVYHRFPTNQGKTSLARHWNRCVALSTERWVWLFSDDDVADPRCVEAFRSVVAGPLPLCDVYRFPVGIVDASGRTIFELARYRQRQSWVDFARARLAYAQMSFSADKIFARSAFDREGGFVEFPYGWCSDDASWIGFGALTGIRQIAGGGVYWRWSGENLSSASAPIQREKVLASVMYLEWLNARMDEAGLPEDERRSLRSQYAPWFYRQLFMLNPNLRALELLRLSMRLARASDSSGARALLNFIRSRRQRKRTREWPAFDGTR